MTDKTDTYESTAVITDEELKSINYALVARYGMDFTDYEPISLKRRITRIIHKYELHNILNLWQKLLYDAQFAQTFKDEISVGLTEMFRNPPVWVFLKDWVSKQLPLQRPLRIWHAGCSTGEEFYSMCILICELGLLQQTEMLVTDLSDRFISIAKEGTYDNELIQKYHINFNLYSRKDSLEKYFATDLQKSRFKPQFVPKMVTFEVQNLVTMSSPGTFDLILCRNVMIYFNETLKLKTLKLFNKSLSSEGLLVIGHFDAMPNGFDQHFKYTDPGLKIFSKH